MARDDPPVRELPRAASLLAASCGERFPDVQPGSSASCSGSTALWYAGSIGRELCTFVMNFIDRPPRPGIALILLAVTFPTVGTVTQPTAADVASEDRYRYHWPREGLQLLDGPFSEVAPWQILLSFDKLILNTR